MKRSIKILLLSCGIIAALGSLTGCHKECACIHNTGTTIYYSRDEVDEINGGNCDGMRFQSGIQYYVKCSWD